MKHDAQICVADSLGKVNQHVSNRIQNVALDVLKLFHNRKLMGCRGVDPSIRELPLRAVLSNVPLMLMDHCPVSNYLMRDGTGRTIRVPFDDMPGRSTIETGGLSYRINSADAFCK